MEFNIYTTNGLKLGVETKYISLYHQNRSYQPQSKTIFFDRWILCVAEETLIAFKNENDAKEVYSAIKQKLLQNTSSNKPIDITINVEDAMIWERNSCYWYEAERNFPEEYADYKDVIEKADTEYEEYLKQQRLAAKLVDEELSFEKKVSSTFNKIKTSLNNFSKLFLVGFMILDLMYVLTIIPDYSNIDAIAVAVLFMLAIAGMFSIAALFDE